MNMWNKNTTTEHGQSVLFGRHFALHVVCAVMKTWTHRGRLRLGQCSFFVQVRENKNTQAQPLSLATITPGRAPDACEYRKTDWFCAVALLLSRTCHNRQTRVARAFQGAWRLEGCKPSCPSASPTEASSDLSSAPEQARLRACL